MSQISRFLAQSGVKRSESVAARISIPIGDIKSEFVNQDLEEELDQIIDEDTIKKNIGNKQQEFIQKIGQLIQNVAKNLASKLFIQEDQVEYKPKNFE